MEWSGWGIYLGSFGLFFLIGFYIISQFLFEDHEIKSKWPLCLFSVTFGFSLVMLEMVFFEIIGIGTQEYNTLYFKAHLSYLYRTRYLKWVVTICALTYTSLFILPTLLLLNILRKLKLGSRSKKSNNYLDMLDISYSYFINKRSCLSLGSFQYAARRNKNSST